MPPFFVLKKEKRKYPDQVVYSEERGFYAKLLPYGSNVGAPSIQPNDIAGWKEEKVHKVNKVFLSQFNDLKRQYEALVEEFQWNDIIYKADYNFEPVRDEIYHLYIRKDNSFFLSLINPTDWDQEYIGSFRLESDNKWKKINT